MCIMWKIRQRKLGVDDFGQPLDTESSRPDLQGSLIPVTQGPPNGERVPEAVSAAVESDIYEEEVSEATPLLKQGAPEQGKGWFSWLLG